jgi:hypothetical protein
MMFDANIVYIMMIMLAIQIIYSILASHTLAHLQAAQADTQTQACKRANFAIAPTNN